MAEALDEILGEDERVTLIGAGFGGADAGGAFLNPVREKYAARIKYPPIAELAYCGIAIGAAMAGMRPIVELSTATFSYEAIPQICNEAAIACSNSGGQTPCRSSSTCCTASAAPAAVQHSGSRRPGTGTRPACRWPCPARPADVKGLLRWAALKSRNPTVFINHQRLMDTEGQVPDGPYRRALRPGRGRARQGARRDDRGYASRCRAPLEAAETLAREDGIDAEVVDPRTLDAAGHGDILASVRKTGRVVVTDESHDNCGVRRAWRRSSPTGLRS